jgi:hypothetical protein
LGNAALDSIRNQNVYTILVFKLKLKQTRVQWAEEVITGNGYVDGQTNALTDLIMHVQTNGHSFKGKQYV